MAPQPSSLVAHRLEALFSRRISRTWPTADPIWQERFVRALISDVAAAVPDFRMPTRDASGSRREYMRQYMRDYRYGQRQRLELHMGAALDNGFVPANLDRMRADLEQLGHPRTGKLPSNPADMAARDTRSAILTKANEGAPANDV